MLKIFIELLHYQFGLYILGSNKKIKLIFFYQKLLKLLFHFSVALSFPDIYFSQYKLM